MRLDIRGNLFVWVCAAAVMLAATPASGGELTSAQIADYARRCRDKSRATIKLLEDNLETQRRHLVQVKRGHINPRQSGAVHLHSSTGRVTFTSKDIKRENIAKTETSIEEAATRLADFQQGELLSLIAMPNTGEPAVGMLGTLPNPEVTVTQVLGPTEMLIRLTWFYSPPFSVPNGRGGQFRTPARERTARFWVRGVPTEEFADESRQFLRQAFHIAGTQQYETEAGSRSTVFVIEPVDLAPFLKPAPRKWASADGKFSVTASYVSATTTAVTLKRSSGKTIVVPLKKLSRADRDWVKERTGGE